MERARRTPERIYADFLKRADGGHIKLTTLGTKRDLDRLGIRLEEGAVLHLYADDADEHGRRDDLLVDGIAHYDESGGYWVAIIDPDSIRHESDPDAFDERLPMPD